MAAQQAQLAAQQAAAQQAAHAQLLAQHQQQQALFAAQQQAAQHALLAQAAPTVVPLYASDPNAARVAVVASPRAEPNESMDDFSAIDRYMRGLQ